MRLSENAAPNGMDISAAERLRGTVELFEMILLALPLRDMLLARRVSRTCQTLIERSLSLKEVCDHPAVVVKLRAPPDGLIISSQNPKIEVDLELRFNEPVTIRRTPSPLDGLSSFVYAFEKSTPAPTSFPRYSLGAKFRAHALQLSRENDWKYIELLPGTPYRLSFDLERHLEGYGSQRATIPIVRSLNLLRGRTYIFGVKPGLSLPAYKGRKRVLHDEVDAGNSLGQYSFHKMYEGHVIEYGAVGKSLPIEGDGEVEIQLADSIVDCVTL